ncbi:MAG: class I SAM-dependent methyltransferase [Geminicoccaceae bacterium]
MAEPSSDPIKPPGDGGAGTAGMASGAAGLAEAGAGFKPESAGSFADGAAITLKEASTDYADAGAPEHHVYNVPAFLKLIPGDNLSIVDVACGNGRLAGILADHGHKVIGTEISESGLHMARTHFSQAEFVFADAYEDLRPKLPDGHCDLVVSCEVIEHLFDPEKFLKNAFAMIKPGGHIIVSTPYHGYVKNVLISLTGKWDHHFMVDQVGAHIKFFSAKTLTQMMRGVGFEDFTFLGAGRLPLLWCSMLIRARKPL